MRRTRQYPLGLPPRGQLQGDRDFWAVWIEAVVMWSKDMDIPATRELGRIVRAIRGDLREAG